MSFPNSLKIAFLFGSGISIPAGMPSTQDITKLVLSGENIMRDTDGNFYFGKPKFAHVGFPDEYVPRILKYLERLKSEIDLYYSNDPERNTNYEDLHYIASQIDDSEMGEIDNPVVQSFIDKIRPDLNPLLIGKEYEVRKQWELHELTGEATYYISDIVWLMLSKRPTYIAHLNFIKEACLDKLFSDVAIFTLNHDLILEEFLIQNGIQFTDGFSESVNNVRCWNPGFFESELYKIRLFKLHGSIDWFRLRPEKGGNWGDELTGIPKKWKLFPAFTEDPQGNIELDAVDHRPKILIGTFNKMLDYLRDIYTPLFCLFYRQLSYAQRLVISGYGFGDQGINTRIIEWFYSSTDHKITIIHPAPEKLKRAARGAISNKWNSWISQNRLVVLAKKVEEITWSEISDTF
jgi:hypothetical protein